MSEEKKGFFQKILDGLDKTKENIMSGIDNVLKAFVTIDEELFEELEETLILADVSVQTSLYIMEETRELVKERRITNPLEVKGVLEEVITDMLVKEEEAFQFDTPAIVLVIGVNGVGKTTSIGKMAAYYKEQGKSVMLAAADTFRAAAIDQLEIWADRVDVPIIKQQQNADPAAVVFDAVNAAKARNIDILIVDTAGRLHNKKNLMNELNKISRVIEREYPEAHRETFIVIDATTGQNAISQVKTFREMAPITGMIITKLDGTAKGGIILSIQQEEETPVRFIGVGESIDDLQPFDAKLFAKALFE